MVFSGSSRLKCYDFAFQWVSQNVGTPGMHDETLGNSLRCEKIMLMEVKICSI
jgi:hypothetical protein